MVGSFFGRVAQIANGYGFSGDRCIFDLTRKDYAGWGFNGACFTPFDDKEPGWCKQCVLFRSSS